MSNQILYALSSVGSMSLDNFNSYVTTQYKCKTGQCDQFDIKDIRYKIIRSLDALGYCEFDFDQRYVSICTPSIVSLPFAGTTRAILVGARTESLIKKITSFKKNHKDNIGIEIIPQKIYHIFSQDKILHFPLPDTIMIEAVSDSILRDLTDYLGINGFSQISPSSKILDFSCNLDEVKSRLEVKIFVEPNLPARTFLSSKLSFAKGHIKTDGSRLTTYINPIDQKRLHIYWKEEQGSEIDRDWGRFMVLSDEGVNIIFYDNKTQTMAVPTYVPLPRLLSRVATICSGSLPIFQRQLISIKSAEPQFYLMDAYRAVPPRIAHTIAEKLGQRLQKLDIEKASMEY